MTSLEVNSSFVDQSPYFFSFAQVRITAKSDYEPTVLSYTPTTTTFNSTAKTSTGKSTVSKGPAVQAGVAWSGPSVLKTIQNRWAIIAEMTNNEGNGSENISWRYTHNDAVFEPGRLHRFTREPLPRAFFGYRPSRPAPAAEAEVMVLWSEISNTHNGRQRGFFPTRKTQGVETQKSLVFANFIYQITVVVDLENVKEEFSFGFVKDVPDMTTQVEPHEVSVANSGAIHMVPEKRTAEKDYDVETRSGKLTDRHICIHRAIEGWVPSSK